MDIPMLNVKYKDLSTETIVKLKPCRRCYESKGDIVEPMVRCMSITYKGNPGIRAPLKQHHKDAIYSICCSKCGYTPETEKGFLGWNKLEAAANKWNDWEGTR